MNAFIALLRKDLVLHFSNRRAVLMSLVAPILIAAFFGFGPQVQHIPRSHACNIMQCRKRLRPGSPGPCQPYRDDDPFHRLAFQLAEICCRVKNSAIKPMMIQANVTLIGYEIEVCCG